MSLFGADQVYTCLEKVYMVYTTLPPDVRPGNKPLALFGPSSPKYSQLGCYMLVDFWCKSSTLSPLSRAFAFTTPTEVDIAFEKDWKM